MKSLHVSMAPSLVWATTVIYLLGNTMVPYFSSQWLDDALKMKIASLSHTENF